MVKVDNLVPEPPNLADFIICVANYSAHRCANSSHTMHALNGSRKSYPVPNRQLIVLSSDSKQELDDFVGELTF